MDITEESCLDLFPTETIVYLTPDAEEGQSQLHICAQRRWKFKEELNVIQPLAKMMESPVSEDVHSVV